MSWTSEGVVLYKKPFGEKKNLLTVFCQEYGKCSALVRENEYYNVGDIVHILWKGRNSNSLGHFTVDVMQSAFLASYNNILKLYAIQSVCDMCYVNLHNQDRHDALYQNVKNFLYNITNSNWLCLYVHFEICFLREMGFGFDLSCCALSGSKSDIYYLSPKTGRAASRTAGEQYKDKLFKIPACFHDIFCDDIEDILYGLKITEFFIQKSIPQTHYSGIPKIRDRFIRNIIDERSSLTKY